MDTIDLKKVALFRELDLSVNLIYAGLFEYQRISMANEFYHLPILLLSNGIERFMKCYICYAYFNVLDHFPESNLFSIKLRHNLSELKDHIIKNYYRQKLGIQSLFADHEFLTSSNLLDKLFQLMSDFGRFDRYYYLNIVTGESTTDISDEWDKLEAELVKGDLLAMEKMSEVQHCEESINKAKRIIIKCLLTFIRALSRQLSNGCHGELARSHSILVNKFVLLDDQELATIDLLKFTRD